VFSRSFHVASTLISRIPRCFTNFFLRRFFTIDALYPSGIVDRCERGREGSTIANTRTKLTAVQDGEIEERNLIKDFQNIV